MQRHGWPLAFALIFTLGLCTRALADLPELPNEIINAPSALNGRQQGQLDTFVRAWTDRLMTGLEDEVADARAKLCDLLDASGSTIFESALIADLSPQLARALKSPRVIVRINALIVASHQIDASTVNLALTGLADENAGVRYWAAKVIVKLATAGAGATSPPRYVLTASTLDQAKLLDAAAALLPKEESSEVAGQLVEGMTKLQLPVTMERVIKALNDRVDYLGTLKNAPMAIEERGLKAVYTTLVVKVSGAGAVSPNTLKILALTAYRYMFLALTNLNSGDVRLSQQGGYANMIQLCNTILTWVCSNISAPTPIGDNFDDIFFKKDWAALLHRTEEWYKILGGPSFLFSHKELDISSVSAD